MIHSWQHCSFPPNSTSRAIQRLLSLEDIIWIYQPDHGEEEQRSVQEENCLATQNHCLLLCSFTQRRITVFSSVALHNKLPAQPHDKCKTRQSTSSNCLIKTKNFEHPEFVADQSAEEEAPLHKSQHSLMTNARHDNQQNEQLFGLHNKF